MAGQVASYRAGLRRYVDAMTQSIEDERRRIARELHDETIQNLLAISRKLELYTASEPDPQQHKALDELRTVVVDTLQGIRQISRDLRPLILEDLGLIPALQTLVHSPGGASTLQATFEVSGTSRALSSAQELALYRMTQEALNNIRKHAEANRVWVRLAFEANRVCLTIRDDGRGFKLPTTLVELTQQGRFGLMGIQERIWALGGKLSIQSSPDHGTLVEIELPLA